MKINVTARLLNPGI